MNLCVGIRFVRAFAKGMRSNLCAFLAEILYVWAALAPVTAPGLAAAPAIYNLGTLGGSRSYGTAVNDAGQVTGATGDSFYVAFRYDGTPGSGGIMHDLGTLGGVESVGNAINNAGQVAGRSDIQSNLQTHAFRYDGTPGSGGVMHDLGTLGGTSSGGLAINDAGQVAGFSHPPAPADIFFHAFRYDGTPGSGGVMRDLGTLGGVESSGIAINNAGQVAVVSLITGNSARHAFRYDGTPGSGGVMHDLGTLGGATSYGYGINDAGQVVGFSYTAGVEEHAFLYTGTPGVDGQMIDLDAWLDANNPNEGAKWTLSVAADLSNTGWITGRGVYDPDGPGGIAANDRAYLLDASSLIVPEPASVILLAIAGLGLLVRRRRCVWRAKEFLWSSDGFRARKQIMHSSVWGLLAILLCVSAAVRAVAAASLTPVGDLPGGIFDSFAAGVSADGATVVGKGFSANGNEAFLWTAGGGMVGLGDLIGGAFFSQAFGISADGATVIGQGTSTNGNEAFRWTAGGGVVGLGDLTGEPFFSGALGVSADGATVVGFGRHSNTSEAFRWTAGGGMVGLGDLTGGGFFSRANGVSADGATVVGESVSADGAEAFRWTASGGMVGLGDLTGGSFESVAVAVSADGATVVGRGNGNEAFLWTAGGGMIGLGDLSGGSFDSIARGVSADGATVVGQGNSDIGQEAFLWTSQNGMRRLQDVLSVDLELDLSGWTLRDARAVTSDGLTIVGWGTRNGNNEAFVAVLPTIVPEPGAGALAMLGVSCYLLLKRRCLGQPNQISL